MNRPTELINELKIFKEIMYGYEMCSSDCADIYNYIIQLEKALDKSVDVISNFKEICVCGLGDGNYSWNESIRMALFDEKATFEINNEESEKK